MYRRIIRSCIFVLALASHFNVYAGTISYTGMCDASAAVMLDNDNFVVANDEDNVLRVYSLTAPGAPVSAINLSSFLGAGSEADIEAAARIGDRIYWMTSHGANKNGKPRPDRRRFFATDVRVDANGASLAPVGVANRNLEALFEHEIGIRYGLKAAAKRPPESENALNIEGLAAGPSGGLLIGFRNPIPGGHALIVPLKNPEALVSARDGKSTQPAFGDAIELNLGKLGIRSIDTVPGTSDYLIAAGPAGPASSGTFAIFGWRPGLAPARLGVELPADFRPEALMVDPGRKKLHLLSDDGDDCKKSPAFRLLTVPLPKW